MIKDTKGIRAVLAGVALGALIFFSAPGMLHAQVGNVTIVNPNSYGINIYMKSFDKFGQTYWRRIAGIPQNGKKIFRRVRNGTWIGADNRKIGKKFKSRRVKFSRSQKNFRITFGP